MNSIFRMQDGSASTSFSILSPARLVLGRDRRRRRAKYCDIALEQVVLPGSMALRGPKNPGKLCREVAAWSVGCARRPWSTFELKGVYFNPRTRCRKQRAHHSGATLLVLSVRTKNMWDGKDKWSGRLHCMKCPELMHFISKQAKAAIAMLAMYSSDAIPLADRKDSPCLCLVSLTPCPVEVAMVRRCR